MTLGFTFLRSFWVFSCYRNICFSISFVQKLLTKNENFWKKFNSHLRSVVLNLFFLKIVLRKVFAKFKQH